MTNTEISNKPKYALSRIQALNGKTKDELTKTDNDVLNYFFSYGRKFGVTLVVQDDVINQEIIESKSDESIDKMHYISKQIIFVNVSKK